MKKNPKDIFIEVTHCELGFVGPIPLIRIRSTENKELIRLFKQKDNKFILSFETKNEMVLYSIIGENNVNETFFSMKINVKNEDHRVFDNLFNVSNTWIFELVTENRTINLVIVKSTKTVEITSEELLS